MCNQYVIYNDIYIYICIYIIHMIHAYIYGLYEFELYLYVKGLNRFMVRMQNTS